MVDPKELAELREKLKLFEHLGMKASAKVLRRKISYLTFGADPEAERYEQKAVDNRPRKRVVRWACVGNQFSVLLTCRHRIKVAGVKRTDGLGVRAPYTAICTTCTPD